MIFNSSIGLSSIVIAIGIFIFVYLTSKIFQFFTTLFVIIILYFVWKNEKEQYEKLKKQKNYKIEFKI